MLAVLLAGCRLFGVGGGEDDAGGGDAFAADAGCASLACDGGALLATIAEPEWIRAIVLDGAWAYFAASADDPGGGTRNYFPGSVWRVPVDGSVPAELLARDDHSPIGLALADGHLYWGHAWDLVVSSVAIDGTEWSGALSGAPDGTIAVRARGHALYELTSTGSACMAIDRRPLDGAGFRGTLVGCGAGPFTVDDTTLYAFVNGGLATVPVAGPGIGGDAISGTTFPRQVEVSDDGVLYYDAQDPDRPTYWQIHRGAAVVHSTYQVARMAAMPGGLFVCRPTLSFVATDASEATPIASGGCSAIAVDAAHVVASDGRRLWRLDRGVRGVP